MTRQHFNGRPIPQSVAIVAMGKSQLDYHTHAACEGGYHGVAEEIWAINKMGGIIYHDILWRMDDLKHITRLMYPEYEKMLKQHPLIITSTAYPDFPGSVAYPLEEVLNDIGIPYFNTTPAYALAYAIYLKIPKIYCYGCDYTYPNQLVGEAGRGCFEMLMGMAFTRGIELLVGPTTSLLDTVVPMNERFYGYNKSVTADVVDGRWKIIPTQETVSPDGDVGKEILNDN